MKTIGIAGARTSRVIVAVSVACACCALGGGTAIAEPPAAPAQPPPRPPPPVTVSPPPPLTPAARLAALTTIVGAGSRQGRHQAAPPNPLRVPFEVNLANFFSTESLEHGAYIDGAQLVHPRYVIAGSGPMGYSIAAGGKWFVDCSINELAPPRVSTGNATVVVAEPYPPFDVGIGFVGVPYSAHQVRATPGHLAFAVIVPDAATPATPAMIRISRASPWLWFGCKFEPQNP